MNQNNIYTYDYFQPKEYRFSLDSILLAQKVSSLISSMRYLEEWKVLDLCSGCGIIGLELSLHRPELNHFDFLEVQQLYAEYFQQNLNMIYPTPRTKILNFVPSNYSVLLDQKFENFYDLIISNPPYFFKNEGLLSPNHFKNRCRFFLDSDFETLINATYHCLKPNGHAFLLIRNGDKHGRFPLEDIQMILKGRASVQIIDDIRGTHIVQMSK